MLLKKISYQEQSIILFDFVFVIFKDDIKDKIIYLLYLKLNIDLIRGEELNIYLICYRDCVEVCIVFELQTLCNLGNQIGISRVTFLTLLKLNFQQ